MAGSDDREIDIKTFVRVQVEADVEYRLIKAAWISWQATGDDEFIRELLIEYPAPGAYIKYKYLSSYKSVKLEIEGTLENIDLELYLPENKKSISVNVKGGDIKTINKDKKADKYFRCSIKKYGSLFELTIKLSRK